MADLKDKIEALGGAFDEFKTANDERLASIEKKGSADILLTEKVDRINAAVGDLAKEKDRLDKIEAAMNRGEFGGGGASESEAALAEHSAGFNAYFRKGVDAGLGELSVNAAVENFAASTTISSPAAASSAPADNA